MQSKDLSKMNFRQELAEALSGNDTDKVTAVFEKYAGEVKQDILNDFENYKQSNDAKILAERGVHQLTSEERKFYQALKTSLETGDITQSFTGLDNAYPETVINSVVEGIRSEFPLLNAIDFNIVSSLVTKVLKNGTGAAKAEWGALNTSITKELSGAIDVIDITLCKLTAWMPVPKDMLQAGLEWLDAYVRALLVEATGMALCNAVINGDGKNCPIGMSRDVSSTASVVGGVYPLQTAIEVDNMSVDTFCALYAALCEDENGRSRTVEDVICVVNPKDYFLRILPNIAYRNSAGEYVYTVPMPITFIQDANIEQGKAVIGIGHQYNLSAGYGGKEGVVNFDDSYKFLEDVRVYMSKLHANGCPKDASSFLLLDISAIPAAAFKAATEAEKTESDSTGK